MHRSLRPSVFHPLVLVALAVCVEARGDWLVLRNGESIRGIDPTHQGDVWRFTTEDGERVTIPADEVFRLERAPRSEKVEFRGRRVTLHAKIETLRRERSERLARGVADFSRWARAVDEQARAKPASEKREGAAERPDGEKPSQLPADAARALERWASLPTEERESILVAASAHPTDAVTRRRAVAELEKLPSERSTTALARRALLDDYRSVRDASLAALRGRGAEKSVEHWIDALSSREPRVRERAANALAVLPHRRAVGPLIDTFHLTWTGFGRGFMMQVTQRAYVADYELVSGGTGFAIVEVADPVVKTTETGVALDVHVRKVEAIARLRALTRITGRDFGPNLAQWRRWWQENRELDG